MTMAAKFLAITLIAVCGMGLPASSQDYPPQGDVWINPDAQDGGFPMAAGKSHQQSKGLKSAVDDAESDGRSPTIGILVGTANHGDGTVSNDEESSGGPAYMGCMVTDDVPQVASLPACGEVVLEQDESQPADSAGTSEPSAQEPVIITVTQSEFAKLPLQAPTVNLQPERGWVLVNMETVAYADDAPQVLTTELLGVPVAVRATPVEFAWDFGDGSAPVVTTSGGRPWPNQTVAHAYTAAAQEQLVTLTTTWSGEFQVAGQGPWIPIAGTVTTRSQSSPFAVETRHSHLVGAQGN